MALDAARDIVGVDGLKGLSTRRIAAAIGYSAGTLYQLFEDLDDLVIHMNAETLDALYQACRNVDLSGEPEAALRELANCYIRFIGEHPKRWSALFEHQRPERPTPGWYDDRISKLLGLAENVVRPLLVKDGQFSARHHARVLWSGLYGIASLAGSQSLAKEETPEALVRSLVENYVAGLSARGAQS
jgi:AcrR family transcriptional regulator